MKSTKIKREKISSAWSGNLVGLKYTCKYIMQYIIVCTAVALKRFYDIIVFPCATHLVKKTYCTAYIK